MQPNPPNPKNRGWRDQVKPAGRKNEAEKAWRKEATAPAKAKTEGWSRRTKLLFASLGIFALVGGIIYFIWMILLPRPPFVAFTVADYETNLAIPVNISGANTIADLTDTLGNKGQRVHQCSSAENWQEAFDKFKGLYRKPKTFVLFPALHGGADEKGPYLILDKENPGDDAKSLIRLDAILEEFRGLPEETRKLLILDATQVRAIRRLMLGNDFARSLQEQEQKIKDIPNLVVLCSASPFQKSWYSEEWRKTAFGYYLGEGLKGAADLKEEGGDNSGRVSALELFRYVRKKVQIWAHDNRDAGQEPMLLPQGAEGEERARNMELVVYEKYEPPAEKVPTAPAIPERKLTEAWANAQKLMKDAPSAAVYSPHLLTKYLDTLIRAEQLFRAGREAKANYLLDSLLAQTQRDIESKKGLKDLESLSAAFPMPAVLGQPDRMKADKIRDQMEPLWTLKSAKERVEHWKKIFGQKDKEILYVRLGAWLYDQVLGPGDLWENATKAHQIVKDLEIAPENRPAELHHLFKWYEDLPYYCSGNVPKHLKLALQTRRLAERAALDIPAPSNQDNHPYREFVYRWIQAAQGKADESRRKGQDLLFSSLPRDRETSESLLKDAFKRYEAIQEDAEKVRQGFVARSQVMAELPYFSRWLAEAQLGTHGNNRAIIDWVRKTQDLWDKTHNLNRLLEAVPEEDPAAQIKKIQSETKKVGDDFKAIKEDLYNKLCKKLAGLEKGKGLKDEFHALEAALSVPFVADPESRLRMLGNLRDISEKLNKQTGQQAEGGANHPDKEDACFSAQRMGRINLAMLGKDTFKQSKDNFTLVKGRLEEFDPARPWWNLLALCNEDVGARWRQLPREVKKIAEPLEKSEDLDRAARDLLLAERLCRQMDGAGANSIQPLDPVSLRRKLHAHYLLLWQAQRTLDDRWFDENNKEYYRAVGLKYVRDARALLGGKGKRLGEAQRREQELETPVDIRFAWPEEANAPFMPGRSAVPEVHITSEADFPLHYRIDFSRGLKGYPVARVAEIKIKADPDKIKDWGLSRSYEIGDKTEPAITLAGLQNPNYPRLFTNQPASPEIAGNKTPVKLDGHYRGKRFPLTTDVFFHRRANTIIYQYPLPPRAGTLVFASDALHEEFSPKQGALTILLDLSGSMDFNLVLKDKTTPTRLEEAKKALDKMLAALPTGLEVSFWIFKGPTFAGGMDKDIKKIFYTKSWDKEDAATIKRTLRRYPPKGGTPMVEALEEAVPELMKTKRKRKTLVVLTDGVPDEGKGAANLRRLPAKIKSVFRNAQMRVHVVGFKLTQLEADEVDIAPVFKKAIEKLKGKNLLGSFHPVEKTKDLIAILLQTLKWNYQFLTPGTDEDEENSEQLAEISREKEVIGELRLADWYRFNLDQHKRKLFWDNVSYPDKRPAIDIGPGELWPYRMVKTKKNEFQLQRASLLRKGPDWNKTTDGSKEWIMAVPDNLKVRGVSQELLVFIESLSADLNKTPAPSHLWLELRDKKGQPILGQRWGGRPGYPAPAWRLEAENLKEADLRAWVRDTTWGGQSIRVLKDKGPLVLEVYNTTVTDVKGVHIESCRVEQFNKVDPVDSLGKRDDHTKVWCLVVRLSYPKDSPILAWPEPMVDPEKHGGFEHHFYVDVGGKRGKYTGIFWYGALSDKKVKDKVERIRLYSVTALQTNDVTRKLKMSLEAPSGGGPIQDYRSVLGLK
jgi:hypothetical protein